MRIPKVVHAMKDVHVNTFWCGRHAPAGWHYEGPATCSQCLAARKRWADDIKAKRANRTPAEVEADERWYREWVAALPAWTPGEGLQPREVEGVFTGKRTR